MRRGARGPSCSPSWATRGCRWSRSRPGVHGDEPAGVWALHSLVPDGLLDPRYSYRLWPCFNPTGFDAGTRTNAEGIGRQPQLRARRELTRSARRSSPPTATGVFALSIDLHEDHEAAGFYLYETAPSGRPAAYARPVDRRPRAAGFPLQHARRRLRIGAARHGSRADAARRCRGRRCAARDAVLRRRAAARARAGAAGVPCALTFETPRRRATGPKRVAMHRVAVRRGATSGSPRRRGAIDG